MKRNLHRQAAMPVACVMGDTDLIRPLALLGIPCYAVGGSDLVRYSRHTRGIVSAVDAWKDPERLVEDMLRFAAGQRLKPILFYQGDGDLLTISRHRERLAEGFRFVVPPARLVEDLTDKRRFAGLADELDLPTPRTRFFSPATNGTQPPELDAAFPCIVKPLVRRHGDDPWDDLAAAGKAIAVRSQPELDELWPRLAATGLEIVVQDDVPGPETRVESYHAYIDDAGETVGEFTGQKIRTLPRACGHTSALRITDEADVVAAGRSLLRRLDFHGVAKVDFKRDPGGRLWLLEVNARFTLWNNPAAVAGVNIPGAVYADLAGIPRPDITRPRAGVRWCDIYTDRRAAALDGISSAQWARWALSCESRHAVAADDPMPFLRGILLPYVGQRARRRLGRAPGPR